MSRLVANGRDEVEVDYYLGPARGRSHDCQDIDYYIQYLVIVHSSLRHTIRSIIY